MYQSVYDWLKSALSKCFSLIRQTPGKEKYCAIRQESVNGHVLLRLLGIIILLTRKRQYKTKINENPAKKFRSAACRCPPEIQSLNSLITRLDRPKKRWS